MLYNQQIDASRTQAPNMLKKIIILVCISLISLSCSKTVKGPLSGKDYNVNLGGWSDMEKYKEAREDAISKEQPLEKSQDCNVVDCPDSVKEGRQY